MTGSEKALCHCRMLHNNPLWAVDNYMHTIYLQAHVLCSPEFVCRNNLLWTCFMTLIFLDIYPTTLDQSYMLCRLLVSSKLLLESTSTPE
jgi:hypothetical protein